MNKRIIITILTAAMLLSGCSVPGNLDTAVKDAANNIKDDVKNKVKDAANSEAAEEIKQEISYWTEGWDRELTEEEEWETLKYSLFPDKRNAGILGKNLTEIYVGAISCGNSELVDEILTDHPDFDPKYMPYGLDMYGGSDLTEEDVRFRNKAWASGDILVKHGFKPELGYSIGRLEWYINNGLDLNDVEGKFKLAMEFVYQDTTGNLENNDAYALEMAKKIIENGGKFPKNIAKYVKDRKFVYRPQTLRYLSEQRNNHFPSAYQAAFSGNFKKLFKILEKEIKRGEKQKFDHAEWATFRSCVNRYGTEEEKEHFRELYNQFVPLYNKMNPDMEVPTIEQEPLYESSKLGDLAAVKKKMESGKYETVQGLKTALLEGHRDIFRYALEHPPAGIDFDTALDYASLEEFKMYCDGRGDRLTEESLKFLFSGGSAENIMRDYKGQIDYLLKLGMKFKYTEMNNEGDLYKYLNDNGRPIAYDDLTRAIEQHHPEVVKAIIECGVDVNNVIGKKVMNVQDDSYDNSLETFIKNPEESKALIPLTRAITHGTSEIVDILLDAGADMTRPDTANLIVCTSRKTLKVLLEHGYDVNTVGTNGVSVIEAIKEQRPDMYELIKDFEKNSK